MIQVTLILQATRSGNLPPLPAPSLFHGRKVSIRLNSTRPDIKARMLPPIAERSNFTHTRLTLTPTQWLSTFATTGSDFPGPRSLESCETYNGSNNSANHTPARFDNGYYLLAWVPLSSIGGSFRGRGDIVRGDYSTKKLRSSRFCAIIRTQSYKSTQPLTQTVILLDNFEVMMSFMVALYYPWIDFRDEGWLKSAILYWDSMRTIVPASISHPYSSRTAHQLQEAGILPPDASNLQCRK